MCSCKSPADFTQDVSCIGIPLSRLPDLPVRSQSLDVLETGLEVLEHDSLVLPHLTSLRISNNRLLLLQNKAFMSSKSLRSIDLSYNNLESVPHDALKHLRHLEWLNLHGNNIGGVEADWGGPHWSLTHLFLGDNDLVRVELSGFRGLVSLGLDSNRLGSLGALPHGLHTLSLSHNQLRSLPALGGLHSLSWLYLRDNFIDNLKSQSLPRRILDKLDLGDNQLSVFNLDPKNGTVIRDLNLDGNHFQTIPPNAFNGFTITRISMTNNYLESLSDNAFDNLANSLEYLELGENRLQKIPRALGTLRQLKYLYIPSNNISLIQNDAFDSMQDTLSALSLSGNKLESIPSIALKNCKNLAHLNLGYNSIREIREEEMEDWARKLDTLLLMNNRIVDIHEHTFRQAPRLRELSLSFNNIASVHPEAFSDVSLESLEISFGLHQEEFPEDSLRPLTSLMWLALDNNNFVTITDSALQNLASLRYINLDGNWLREVPHGLFRADIHRYLRDIRISGNHLRSLESFTFSELHELQFVVVSRNQISVVKSQAFNNLSNKLSIFLEDNRISNIETGAFNELPNLIKVDLHSNNLQELSLDVFSNSTNEEYPMSVNLSRNALTSLLNKEGWVAVNIKSIDLSYNLLPEVPKTFLDALRHSLRKIYLGYNHVSRLDEEAFGELSKLEALAIEHNSIVKLRKRAFAGLHRLQILDLSHNHIEQLHMEQFKHLSNLRVLDLSYNHLRTIPRDAFQNTKLERIDLSNNEFLVMPSGSLGEVGFTLRVLDISNNHVEHLDSTMFPETPLLTGLSLANNRINLVPDNVFTSLGSLLRLDLSGNRLQANFKELFHYLQSLRLLNLAEIGLTSVPVLPLPNLVSLNISRNDISDFPVTTAEALPRLRTLFIDHCSFTTLPSAAWPKLSLLKHLDFSYNPVKEVTEESVSGLGRLERLDMMGLGRLERLELPRGSLPRLRHLGTDTARGLGSLLSAVPALLSLSVRVSPGTTRLRHQLARLPAKVRHLEITGESLKEIEAGALRGLHGEAVVSLRGTSVEELPLGLLSGLGRVSHLTLDIRDNRITSLSPDTFYYNLTAWEDIGTKLISGGLLLKNNPLVCDCSLVWVGHWLRRWLRESLLIHTTDPETGGRLVAAAREAECRERGGRLVPLLDLYPEHLSCQASALSGANVFLPSLIPLIVIIAFLS